MAGKISATNVVGTNDPSEAALAAIEEALSLMPIAGQGEKLVPDLQTSEAKKAPGTSRPQITAKPDPVIVQPVATEAVAAPDDFELAIAAAMAAPTPTSTKTKRGSEKPITEEVSISPPAPQQAAPLVLPRGAANDDRREIGHLLHALQIKAPVWPLWLAFFASLGWIAASGTYFWGRMTTLSKLAGSAEAIALEEIGIAAISILGPVLFLFAIASVFRRASELRRTSRAMAEIALRLAEPESVAADSVFTLGQAIRREVSSVGDGIERALARATELEVIVHNEVAALERSYSDNELRIRALVDELVTQRETINSNAEQVRQSLIGASDTLTSQLTSAGTRVTDALLHTGSNVTSSLDEKRDQIAAAFGGAGQHMIDQISQRSEELIARLNVTGDNVSARISETGAGVSESLAHSGHALVHDVSTRSEAVVKSLEDISAVLRSSFEDGAQTLASTLGETGSDVVRRITDHSQTLTQSLKDTGDQLVVDLGLRSSEVSARFDESAHHFSSTVSAHGEHLAERLNETHQKIADTIGVHGTSLYDNLNAASEKVSEMLNLHTSTAKTALDSHVSGLSEALQIASEDTANRLTDSAKDIVLTQSEQVGRVNDVLN